MEGAPFHLLISTYLLNIYRAASSTRGITHSALALDYYGDVHVLSRFYLFIPVLGLDLSSQVTAL